MKSMAKNKIDIIIGVVFSTVSLFCYIFAYQMIDGGMETDLGSMFLPRLLLFIMFLLSVIMLVNIFRKNRKHDKQTRNIENEYLDFKGYANILKYLVIVIIYWLIMPYLGFLITTPFMMFSVMYLLSGRKWLVMGCVSLILTVAVKFGFYYGLRVMLPTCVLF